MIKNITLALGVVTISTVAFGQKKNLTSAAVAFGSVKKDMMSQNFDKAKKDLIEAKEFIDLAAAHEETKNNQKMYWYKGEIYSSFMSIGMMSQDTAFMMLGGEDAIDVSIESFAKGYPLGKKYKMDIKDAVNQKVGQINMYAGMTYEAEMFAEAAELYDAQWKYLEAIEVFDSSGIYNSAYCYSLVDEHLKAAERYEKLAAVEYKGAQSSINAANEYRNAGNVEKSLEIINKARETYPSDKGLLLELVNSNIEAGDMEGAEKSLNDAIAADPGNKQLYFVIGTIYTDLGEYQKAEDALNKALEIDPDYADAQYNLGSNLLTWGGDLKREANDLDFGDSNYNTLIKKSDETYARALIPLEKYITIYPNDKAILNILYQINKNLGNSEKALEYKKRAAAAE